MYSVSDETRKPIFEGVQGENEAREIQFDVTAWVEELGEGVCTATAKRPTDAAPYPVTVTRSGNVVTWKPNSADTSIEGIGAFQLAFSINDVVAKTRIWNTKIAPSLVGAGDPPDPYDDWIQDLRDIAAETLTYSQNAENSADDAEAEKLEAEAWAKGTKNGTPVSSSDAQYQNNAKYWAEQSAENQYGAYIVKSASGDIASFSDGGDDIPMKSLKVTITPKQAGSGDPSPNNVRPISGFDTANITVAGKNIAVNNKGDATISGVTFSVQADGSVKVSGTASATIFYTFRDNYKTSTEIGLKAGEQYMVSGGKSANLRFGMQRRYGSNVLDTGSGVSFTADETEQYNIAIYIPTGATVNDTVYPMVRPASADATYEPAKPITTTPVPLGQTVYGVSVNPISGELVIDRAIVDIGSMAWAYQIQYTRFYSASIASLIKPPAVNSDPVDAICSCFKVASIDNYANYELAGSASGNIFIKDSDYTDADAFKTAMAGQTICYKLKNPTTVQLTPTEVRTLLGTNNVWADCGSVAVEYRADPTLAYNELANVIVSLGGNI